MKIIAYVFLFFGLAVWWNIEESQKRPRLTDLITLGAILLLSTTYLLLPENCEFSRELTFVTGVSLVIQWAFARFLRLLESCQRIRMHRRLEKLPLREEFCTAATYPCSLSFDDLYHLLHAYCTRKGTNEFTGVYEPEDGLWDIQADLLPDGNWVLALWDDCAEDELRDKELITILCRHQLSFNVNLLDIAATTFAVCRAGELHIYPASTASICKRLGMLPPEAELPLPDSDTPGMGK